MTINLHSLFQGCDERVLDTFFKLVNKIKEDETKELVLGGSKKDKLYIRAAEYKAAGKSIERALADACSDFKIAGAVP